MDIDERILNEAIAQGIVNSEITALGIMDFDGLTRTVEGLKAAFGDNFFHTFAVKANSLHAVTTKLAQLGMGAEVASPGELLMAQSSGFTADQIIFDSPAKTMADIENCLQNNIAFNLDNEQELARVDQLRSKYPDSRAVIGFRVNPQIGSGKISSTSTATNTSKFGYPLRDGDNYQRLLSIYAERPWLTSIHTHTGSQGCPLALMAEGISEIIALAEEINGNAANQQITQIDIGGGLPVNFASDEVRPTFAEYAALLREKTPLLFTGKYRAKTEFGRAIAAKNGFIVTRVEYTKNSGGRHIATTHAGAQIMTRTAFLPEAWPIRVRGFTPQGAPRQDDVVQTDVAGPCCFAADLVAKNTAIPRLHPDDYVLIYDTGAYYFSNHFDYNSLPRVAVYAAETSDGATRLRQIRRAETLQEVIDHMS